MKTYIAQFMGVRKLDNVEGCHRAAVHAKNERMARKEIAALYDVEEWEEFREFSRMPNVRFWVWENGGWVKLTLRPEQELRWGKSWSHEEGYSYESNMWTYEGDAVFNHWENGGRDCDGPIRSNGVSICHIEYLQSVPAGSGRYEGPDTRDFHNGKLIMRADWRKFRRTSVHDVYAQMAGY